MKDANYSSMEEKSDEVVTSAKVQFHLLFLGADALDSFACWIK